MNYSISAEELQSWLLDSGEQFYSEESKTPKSLSELLNSNATGIYFSDQPGFVLWLMNANLDVNRFLHDGRKFSLDADLIVGAIDNAKESKYDRKVAIIGRERSIPIYELPALNTDMLLMLATTKYSELHQSYERNHLLAGKLPRGKDFAPILLSPELWHTEYGSLLNITDQFLKSWSENGGIAYENFPYPKPNHWTFNKGVFTDLNSNGSLTYNWNTAGAGYYITPTDDCPYRIFAVNRTGSLPVSYIPEGVTDIDQNNKIFKAEEKAYNFFSHLNNPELVRVVQYASFYQIMQYIQPTILGENIHKLNIYDISHQSLDQNEQKVKDAFKTAQITKQHIVKYYDKQLRSYFGSQYANLPSSYRNQLCNEEATPKYNKLITAQSSVRSRIAENNDTHSFLSPFLFVEDALQDFNQIYQIVPIKTARDEYVQENQYSSSNWIKCPTIVQSWSIKDSASWIGGHNLNSSVTPIILDNEIKQGHYYVSSGKGSQKTITVNPQDYNKITPDFLRIVNRTNIIGSQTYTTKSIQVRSRNQVMKATQQRTSRGFNPTDHVYKKAS